MYVYYFIHFHSFYDTAGMTGGGGGVLPLLLLTFGD